MSIYKDQNSKEKIQLLSAYSAIYSQAKKIMGIRIIISILVTIGGILVAFLFPSTQIVVGSIGAAWSLISEMFLKSIEKQKIKKGATIQEEFDTSLFNLSWNQSLIGNKVAPEIIIAADREFNGDRQKLQYWYPNTKNAQRPLDVLLCQRSGVIWDWRLRQMYIILVVGSAILFLVVELLIAFVLDQSVINFFLTLFLPSSSLYLIAFEVFKDNYDLLSLRQKLEDKIAKLLSKGKGAKTINLKVCRDIQDDLYRLRSKGALIPNWFYFLFRDSFETDMQKATKILTKDI